ncbi:hypothetical protein V5O48_009815 [Marasmius crinis-equi]|uniref:Uncharacterized protein n=1 Tax=Marasmius crinis-equi TaxID=585013 RepID=A0ABR3FA46_9AGAR
MTATPWIAVKSASHAVITYYTEAHPDSKRPKSFSTQTDTHHAAFFRIRGAERKAQGVGSQLSEVDLENPLQHSSINTQSTGFEITDASPLCDPVDRALDRSSTLIGFARRDRG